MSWTDHFKEDETVFPVQMSQEARERIRDTQRQMRLRVLNGQIHRQRRA